MTTLTVAPTSGVKCPTMTVDPAVRPASTASVPTLADLLSVASDVTFTRPSELGSCEGCMGTDAVAVATLTWPDPDHPDDRDEITVCRGCLGTQVDYLARDLDLEARIAVEAPAWTLDEVAEAIDVPAWEVDRWGLLVAEDVNGRPGYLADEIAHARRMLALGREGVSLIAANRLLRGTPELATEVEKALGAAA